MKLAKVRYVGPMRSSQRRGPSGERYTFRNPMGGDSRWVDVDSLEDARAFTDNDVFEVEWTAQGEIVQRVGSKVDDATEAVTALSYRQKQRLVKALGLDVKGNSPEDELTEALAPAVEEMVNEINR